MNYYFDDFTETNYRNLLRLAKRNYRFAAYDEYKSNDKMILWRHDIDASVHRAYRLAQIEAEEKVRTTFFVHLHNEMYNALETEIAGLLYRISELGHDIGLHFDPLFYGLNSSFRSNMEYYLNYEKEILEKIFGKEVRVFSFHNPEFGDCLKIENELIAGMINTYSNYFKANYKYCSDSNGYWRFERLEDLLTDAAYQKFHILTHPEWWTPDVLSPRERITRCINGRAERQHLRYDEALLEMGRENVK